MSHYTKMNTKITNPICLSKALIDLGYAEMEYNEVPQHLYGYQGDRREQTAELIIRRKYIGHAANDIGFKRTQDGTFEALISDFDRATHNLQWMNRLQQRYAYHVTVDQLKHQGMTVTEETAENGEIHLLLERSY